MVDVASAPFIAEDDIWSPGVHALQNGWRPTGGAPNPAADEGLLNWPLQELANRTVNLRNRVDRLVAGAALEITVGAGGDFATINAALAEVSERRTTYVPGGVSTTVRLLTGFVMAEQVHVSALNLGWVTIVGDDPETLIDRAALVGQVLADYPAFAVSSGGFLPAIGTVFTMTGTGPAAGRIGLSAIDGSTARVLSGAGFKSCGGAGAAIYQNSALTANGAIFNANGGAGVIAVGGTRVTLVEASLRNNGGIALDARQGAAVNANSCICGGSAAGIAATNGAQVAAAFSTPRTGSAQAPTDLAVSNGSIITATGATGGTNVAVNTVSAAGIIFK